MRHDEGRKTILFAAIIWTTQLNAKCGLTRQRIEAPTQEAKGAFVAHVNHRDSNAISLLLQQPTLEARRDACETHETHYRKRRDGNDGQDSSSGNANNDTRAADDDGNDSVNGVCDGMNLDFDLMRWICIFFEVGQQAFA